LEFLGVIKILPHGVRVGGVLVQDAEIELVRPPISIGGGEAGHLAVVERAFGFCGHGWRDWMGFYEWAAEAASNF
jgi:hypothetical protein